jgi:uncharacterized membrane protein YeaQ/YmgE (transglycosylase-associated protein family)
MDSSTILPNIISLISGGVGGYTAGALLKKFSLGPIGNTIVGLRGGGVGQQLLAHLTSAATTGGSGMAANLGGAIWMAILGAIKNAAATKTR